MANTIAVTLFALFALSTAGVLCALFVVLVSPVVALNMVIVCMPVAIVSGLLSVVFEGETAL